MLSIVNIFINVINHFNIFYPPSAILWLVRLVARLITIIYFTEKLQNQIEKTTHLVNSLYLNSNEGIKNF